MEIYCNYIYRNLLKYSKTLCNITSLAIFSPRFSGQDNIGFVLHTPHKQVDAPSLLNLHFKGFTLGLEVSGIAIQDVGILGLDVHKLKEVVPHVRVITLWVVPWKTW